MTTSDLTFQSLLQQVAMTPLLGFDDHVGVDIEIPPIGTHKTLEN